MTRYLQRYTVLFCVLVALWTAVVPVVRAFLHGEVSYNEGWNIYAAERVSQHLPIYPATYEWTTVNYPMLSFALMAGLHRFTHDYLFTARVVSLLSLLVCGVLIAVCVHILGGSRRSAALAGLYGVAVFCASQNGYVGVDDPQILADAVFLLGFAVYLYRRRSLTTIALSALVFTVAFSVKHSPLEFIFAVAIDLAIMSLPLALWFAVCGAVFGALSFALHLRYGGHGFLLQLLAPRAYTASYIADRLRDVVGPLLVPFVFAFLVAFAVRRNPQRRILAILMATSLAVGGYFSGGHGVSNNCLFGVIFALCMLLGLLWDRSSPVFVSTSLATYAPPLLFLWLLIPMALNDDLNFVEALRDAAAESQNLLREAELIRSRPGPAFCENLLVCYEAGKPFVYDPYNATRLITAGKLDQQTLLNQIRNHAISTIQLETTLSAAVSYERFTPAAATAILENYERLDAPLTSGIIYVPNRLGMVAGVHFARPDR